MAIHLVYPYDPDRKASAPWSIGHNLGRYLRRQGHHVIQYDWDERQVIQPQPGDILIGHPHPEPGKVFRNSVCGPWAFAASIAPWNGSEEYRGQQEYAWKMVDHHFAICGARWSEPDMKRECNCDGPQGDQPYTRLDMAIDPAPYPLICAPRPTADRSRVLYIGCTIDHLKGTDRLADLARKMPTTHFGHIGYGRVQGVQQHGYLDLLEEPAQRLIRSYDFLIAPGRHDANTTTVLEAMCWGLVPIMSKGCGWGRDVRGFHLPDDEKEWPGAICEAMEAPESELSTIAKENRQRAKSHYTWDRFGSSVNEVIETATGARSCQAQKLSA